MNRQNPLSHTLSANEKFCLSGNDFVPGDSGVHAWNAVFLSGSWRLLDCTWGAGKINPEDESFTKELNEHFFLTDPDELIFTHFPYDEVWKKF